MQKHVGLRIYGNVIGVGFRWSTQRRAAKLNLKGFVRNDQGFVSAEAQGEAEDVEKFIAWCRRGTLFSGVKRIEIEELPLSHFDDFTIEA